MNNYSLIKKIGQGSFGEVSLVSQKQDPKLYVMKMVKNASNTDSANNEAMKEVNIMKRLRHPNIVEFKECFPTDDGVALCIVMGYCECGDLSAQIQAAKKRKKFLRESDILDWFVQLAMALKYLHGHHVLHRDLKPQNVFLTNNTKILKLGDFGITKVLEDTMACANTTIGTPYYFSPEICQSRPYGVKSDIWAAGCIVYELMVLTVPFMAANLRQLVQKILFSKPATPNSTLYSKDLLVLIAAMLAKSPERRPDIKKVLSTPLIRNHLQTFISKYASLYDNENMDEDVLRQQAQEVDEIQNRRDAIILDGPQEDGLKKMLSGISEQGETPSRCESPTARSSETTELEHLAKNCHAAVRRSEEKDDIDDLVNLCTRELHLEQTEPLIAEDLAETDGYDLEASQGKPASKSEKGRRGSVSNSENRENELASIGKALIQEVSGEKATLCVKGNNYRPGTQAETKAGPVRGIKLDNTDKDAASPLERHSRIDAPLDKLPSKPDGAKRNPSPRTRSKERRERKDSLGEIGKDVFHNGLIRAHSGDQPVKSKGPISKQSDFELGIDPQKAAQLKREDQEIARRRPSFDLKENELRRPRSVSRNRSTSQRARPSSRERLPSIERT